MLSIQAVMSEARFLGEFLNISYHSRLGLQHKLRVIKRDNKQTAVVFIHPGSNFSCSNTFVIGLLKL